eukprot:m.346020 g.346020  ORF g.346020 m.346020 type:complete len:190 (+) comp27842_c0_seq1:135-704(+)
MLRSGLGVWHIANESLRATKGIPRYLCHATIKRENKRVLVAVYLALVNKKNNNLLMLRRQNTGYYDGNFTLVSGHVEEGESIVGATVREAKEEAGLDVKEDQLEVYFTMMRQSSKKKKYVDFFLKIKDTHFDDIDLSRIHNAEPHKASEVNFYPLSKLPGNTIDYVRFAIDQLSQSSDNVKPIFKEWKF